MTVALVVITDGRGEYLEEAVTSAEANLPHVDERWMWDDSGDDEHRVWLGERFPKFIHINGGRRQGFGGAIRGTWAELRHRSTARHIVWMEGDFVFTRPVDLDAMRSLLDNQPQLAQVVLKRQPWSSDEQAAGGIIEQHPDDYTDRQSVIGGRLVRWVEHRRFYSTNVGVFRRSLLQCDWPEVAESEGHFTHQLLRDGTPEAPGESVRFAFWGGRHDPPAIHHIGHQRAGKGY